MHLMTCDAEFVGDHVRSLRCRVRRASVWDRPSHPIVGHEVGAPSSGSSGRPCGSFQRPSYVKWSARNVNEPMLPCHPQE